MFYPNRIKIVIFYKNFFSYHDFLFYFFKSVINRKEPEPQFVISAPAPGYLISAPRLRLPNTDCISVPVAQIRESGAGIEFVTKR